MSLQTTWASNWQFEKYALVAGDVLALALSFVLSLMVAAPFHGLSPLSDEAWAPALDSVRVEIYVVLALLAVGLFWAHGHYGRRKPFANEIKDVIKVMLCLAALDVASLFLAKLQFSRASVLLNWSAAPCVLVGMRWIAKRTLTALGGWNRPMVIIGWGENAVHTALAFRDEPLMGLQLVAFLVPTGEPAPLHRMTDRQGRPIPVLPLGADPNHTIRALGNPHVVLALERNGLDNHQDLILQLSREHKDVQLVPSLRGLPLYGMEAEHFFAHEVLILTLRNNLARRLPRLIKRGFDLALSTLLLVLGAPLLLFIAFKVRQSGKPVFFGHERIGRDGKPFKCYKFRTMAPQADRLLAELLARDPQARAQWQRDFKLRNDPRITPIGRFLRQTSLDEIPQLWNVLKGDMSLVGPRPVVQAELERYGSQVDYYLQSRPGITGLWQISGRNDVDYDTRVYLDAWYIKNWSLFTDIVILMRTFRVVLRKGGAY